ncbi:hypothetical protein HPP92_002688 [Vanilla planifolia]|uniref:TatD related DNase n=1 Tax=Vanilla planifolia TaxID=51239 RepID=A0A835VMZ6_VANPL|nr:hypothetical protein HPP92_002688 [Vanilla planifolia]
MIVGGKRATLRLFDAHCHLQDPRILVLAPHVIHTAVEAGVFRFAVNGASERDWHIVKQMGEHYSSLIPCFGLHPWYVMERSPLWLQSMKVLLQQQLFAAVGEVGRFSFLKLEEELEEFKEEELEELEEELEKELEEELEGELEEELELEEKLEEDEKLEEEELEEELKKEL